VTLSFTVFGAAQPKGSMRALMLKGMKHPIITESNRNVKSWSQLVAEGASHALQQLPAGQRDLLQFGVRLTIAFYMPRPKKYSKRGVFVPHCVAPDIDKLTRAVLDALKSVAYRDDKQVTEVIAGKYYAAVDDAAHVDIRVEAAPGHALHTIASDRPLFDNALADDADALDGLRGRRQGDERTQRGAAVHSSVPISGSSSSSTSMLSRAEVKPDDVIVIEVPFPLTHEGRARMHQQLAIVWPGQRVLVLDQGMTLKIARAADV